MKTSLLVFAAALLATGCASRPPEEGARARAEQTFRGAFTHGNQELAARVMRQDEVQQLCTQYRNHPPKDVAEKIEKSQQATIVYPASGRLMGDWREGEKIAQDGYGFRFTDTNTKRPNGGNCYACHQIAPQEISYGTLGPSLRGYGRRRGAGEATQRYTYAKIYNSEAFSACSNMPRLGYNKVLTPEQITHLVALLLDPESPANK
jgi:L-cysteine S-thiosulfotransferase